jgi:non-ribosomal peptide synthetase-like protein
LFGFTPGLTTLHSECFVADFVGVNPPEIHHGAMNLGHVEVGRRSFIGNGSVLPPGTLTQDETLLGLLSVPKDEALTLEFGRSYIGSPAFLIPRGRTQVDPEAANRLFNPPCRLYIARLTWETFRAVTPTSLMVLNFFILWMGVVAVYPNQAIYSKEHIPRTAIVGNITPWLFSMLAMIEILILKKIVVGTHTAESNPLWSHGVWRAEFIVDLVTTLGGPAFMNYARGSPLLPVVFRLLGAKIGTGCFIDTIHFTEPDMVTLGDHVSIGDRVTIQTHLFEDRVMKTSHLQIGDRCSIGPNSIILYDTVMEKGCSVGALSLVMKGESYPAGSHWEGAPAERRRIPAIMVIPTPHPSMRPASGPPRSGGPWSHRSAGGGGPPASAGFGAHHQLHLQDEATVTESTRLLAK